VRSSGSGAAGCPRSCAGDRADRRPYPPRRRRADAVRPAVRRARVHGRRRRVRDADGKHQVCRALRLGVARLGGPPGHRRMARGAHDPPVGPPRGRLPPRRPPHHLLRDGRARCRHTAPRRVRAAGRRGQPCRGRHAVRVHRDRRRLDLLLGTSGRSSPVAGHRDDDQPLVAAAAVGDDVRLFTAEIWQAVGALPNNRVYEPVLGHLKVSLAARAAYLARFAPQKPVASPR
jgi:hypothetical protein